MSTFLQCILEGGPERSMEPLHNLAVGLSSLNLVVESGKWYRLATKIGNLI